MECEYCGKKEAMGFTCHRCGARFCSDHKLPENHDCTNCMGYVKPKSTARLLAEGRMKRWSFINGK